MSAVFWFRLTDYKLKSHKKRQQQIIMKLSIAILSLSAIIVDAGCPFSETTNDVPNDDQHRHLRLRRLASLGEGATKDKLTNIIERQKIKIGARRSLIQTSCMTETHYNDIRNNISEMATVVRTIEIVCLCRPYS